MYTAKDFKRSPVTYAVYARIEGVTGGARQHTSQHLRI